MEDGGIEIRPAGDHDRRPVAELFAAVDEGARVERYRSREGLY